MKVLSVLYLHSALVGAYFAFVEEQSKMMISQPEELACPQHPPWMHSTSFRYQFPPSQMHQNPHRQVTKQNFAKPCKKRVSLSLSAAEMSKGAYAVGSSINRKPLQTRFATYTQHMGGGGERERERERERLGTYLHSDQITIGKFIYTLSCSAFLTSHVISGKLDVVNNMHVGLPYTYRPTSFLFCSDLLITEAIFGPRSFNMTEC